MIFADDTLLFSKANSNELKELDKILKKYELMLRQLINYDKFSIILPKHKSQGQIQLLLSVMKLRPMMEGFTYLGMPMFWGKNMTQWF